MFFFDQNVLYIKRRIIHMWEKMLESPPNSNTIAHPLLSSYTSSDPE
jgi:hypothetical protein